MPALSISELASIHYLRDSTDYRPVAKKVPRAFAIITEDGIDQIETTANRAKSHARELRKEFEMDSEIVEFTTETLAYEWEESVNHKRGHWMLQAARKARRLMAKGVNPITGDLI